MKILSNLIEWEEFRGTILQKFNIHHGTVRGQPKEFPCFVVSNPVMDLNGVGINCSFFYCSDASELLKVRLRNLQYD